ncbi:MAG: tetratricopeptide repeat protein, partial [Xenococcus sp. MO_188.B8]|nr:tetratricopeptide repeat protein [Xenococcus sp. MO_188.B8]
MAKLHEYLQEGDSVSIAGMGGVGKTELATQYAHRYQQEYDGILWFNSRDRDLAGEILQFFRLEFEYEIPQELGGKLLNTKEQVAWCWRKYPESNLPILVIFDDVSDVNQLREVLPHHYRFRVLITARRKRLDPKLIQDLPLDVLSPEKEPEKALELLQLLLGQSDRRVSREPEAAAALCECLGYLPLGIELVGGYLAADPDLSLAVMEHQLQAEKLANPALESLNPTQRGVNAAFALTWSKLTSHAQQLGKLLSLFAPKQISWDLVVFVATESLTNNQEEEKQLTWSEKEINEAKKQLYQRNIIQLAEEEAGYYQAHSLVRWFLQEQLRESAEIHSVLATIFIKVMVAAAERIPDTPTSKHIKYFRDFIIHLEELAKSLFNETQQENQSRKIYLDSLLDGQVIWIFTGVGRFYEGQGLFKLAEPWCEKCLATCEFLFQEDHHAVATSLNNLALFYHKQGKYIKAEPLYLQALKMTQSLFAGDHRTVANRLNNLAGLYSKQGRYTEAEPFYCRALEMRKRLYGREHPDLVTSLNNLAGLYSNQGRYTEAEPLYLQSLEMAQRLYEGDHTYVANSLNNLALLYVNQGRHSEAEPLYLQALEMRKRLYEGEHPDVANSLNNLAGLYSKQGRYTEAEPFLLQALEMRKRLYEGEHPDVANSLNNLAGLYSKQGRYTEAEP